MIRAAYHALMRRYHPDADPTQEGAELSRAINEAYVVLRDPAKRARYDESLGLKFEPGAHSAPPTPLRSRLAPAAAIGVALLAMGMVVFAISPPIGETPAPKPRSPAELPAVSATKLVPAKAGQPPAKLAVGSCTASEASRLIKEELFRRAAGLRDADRAQLRQVADHASFRIDTARPKAEQKGVVDCSGWIGLDLPPGLVVDGGRTNLNAELSYALAHDRGRLRIARLSGEGRLVRTLATLGPAPREPEQDLADRTRAGCFRRRRGKLSSSLRRPRGRRPSRQCERRVRWQNPRLCPPLLRSAAAVAPSRSSARTRTCPRSIASCRFSTASRGTSRREEARGTPQYPPAIQRPPPSLRVAQLHDHRLPLSTEGDQRHNGGPQAAVGTLRPPAC